MHHDVETLPGGTRVWTNAHHRFGTDALLLADFCEVRPEWSACDLGAGCGILLLSLLDKGLAGRAVGVELAPQGAALLDGALQENALAGAQSLCADLRCFKTASPFDIVVCNPPYFTGGQPAASAQRAAARHQITCTLADVCQRAAAILKDKGRFCLCYPARYLAPLTDALRAQKLEPKRAQLVRKSPDSEPWLALIEARKFAGPGLHILPDRLLPPGAPVRY